MTKGIRCRFNVMKFRIMKTMYENKAIQGGKIKLTAAQIAELGGLDRHNVQCSLLHYENNEYGYFYRYKPKSKKNDRTTWKAFQYALTKHGIETYKKYCWNLAKGYSLDLRLFKRRGIAETTKDFQTSRSFNLWSRDITIDDILQYIKITKQGKEEMNIKSREDKKKAVCGLWQPDTSIEKTI